MPNIRQYYNSTADATFDIGFSTRHWFFTIVPVRAHDEELLTELNGIKWPHHTD